MRDGVALATDVYLPGREGRALPGPWPVLLCRTVYGKGRSRWGQVFSSRGYATVVQDVRGRFDSEGTFYPYLAEGQDGYDAVEWAAAQPWSNGSVGTFGRSYLAATQLALAMERPPHLKTMVVTAGTSNYYEDGFARGGAFSLLHNVGYLFHLASTSREAAAEPARLAPLKAAAADLASWVAAYPFDGATPLALAPPYQKWLEDWVEHPGFGPYWEQPGYMFETYHERFPDIPTYFVGGWYDIFLRGTLANFVGLAQRNRSLTKLLVGPWVHAMGTRHAGDVDFGEPAIVDLETEHLRWFEEVMKGRDVGILEEPRVTLFMMGGADRGRWEGRKSHGGGWRGLSAWPPRDLAARRYHLHADGTLAAPLPTPAPPSRFTVDPADPVPTIGGGIDVGKELIPDGPRDQRCTPSRFGCRQPGPLSARSDVLVFQTAPLEEELEILGPVIVKLCVSSTAPDTDFTAKLIDVHPPSPEDPDGFAMNLCDGIVRMRHRAGAAVAPPMRPGEIVEITVDLLAIGNRFARGHRIRLDVASTNYPFFDRNPGAGPPIENAVHHHPDQPSHVLLPLRPSH